MPLVLRFFIDFLNLFARRNYYNSFFSNPNTIKSKVYFWFFSITSETLLFYLSMTFSGSSSIFRALFFIFINFLINIFLTLFYEIDKISHRLVIVISLQAINQLSEIIMGTLLFSLIPQLFEKESEIQDTYIVTCSGILSFLIISFISALWKIKISSISFRHLILMCTTPIASVLFVLLMPYQVILSAENTFRITCILIILLSVNILNYFILQDIITQTNLKTTILNQQKQLNHQSEKFSQLSNAYKETRRVVHEVKRYNSYITSCIQKGEYDKIIDFIQESNIELEERFVKINTGNLVVDTFISNYDSISKEKGINFTYEIKIDKDEIPLNDYDLCIILGNVLDNSFNEAETYFSMYSSYRNFSILAKLLITENFFVIHVSNTLSKPNKEIKNDNNLEHGFGILNIQEIVHKYDGIYYQESTDNAFDTTISIPLHKPLSGDHKSNSIPCSTSNITPQFSKKRDK